MPISTSSPCNTVYRPSVLSSSEENPAGKLLAPASCGLCADDAGADIAAVTAHIPPLYRGVDPRTEPGDIVVRVFDEELGLEYDNERKLTAIVGLFALLAVVIA